MHDFSFSTLSLVVRSKNVSSSNFEEAIVAFELYNLHEDPDELNDLYKKDITTASQMKDELLEAISTANRDHPKK